MQRSENQTQTGARGKITMPSLSLPKGGGAIKGLGETFQPQTFTGAAGFNIPFPLSTARALTPSLGLAYSSGGGQGVFGMGFSLSLSSITRKTSNGIPLYGDTDVFLLSGTELVPKAEQGGTSSHTSAAWQSPGPDAHWQMTAYRPRLENSFALIERWVNSESQESYWRIVTADNVTSIYGRGTQARIADPENPTHVFRWLLEETHDAYGNKVRYQYKTENTEGIKPDIFEAGRDHTANRYPEQVAYGNYLYEGREHYAFKLIFDYGEYDLSAPDVPRAQWRPRPDPFSSYRSGFEIRTNRLCRHVLMYHQFQDEFGGEPFLVRALRFDYEQAAALSSTPSPSSRLSFLKRVTEIGFRREDDGTYRRRPLPALELSYSAFEPEGQPYHLLRVADGDSIPGYLGNAQYLPVDLYGEGLPGLLYSDFETTLYWRPRGDGFYEPPESPAWMPREKSLHTGSYTLASLNGDGVLDLVVNEPERSGFYRSTEAGPWAPYREFASRPFDLTNSFRDMVDLTGDGRADLLLFEDDRIKFYPSQGAGGFGAARGVLKRPDFPAVENNYEEELLTFADVFGDGLQHRVRIRNGSVECWPSLGYGRFGEKVTLGNAPRFGETMSAERLFLADIDGTGTADIVYLSDDHMSLFFNQSGNQFSKPLRIPLPAPYDNLTQISFADVLGNGTSCLILTRAEPEVKHYYYDFCNDAKPYLLTEIDNNMGARTRVTYSSTVKQYLKDKRRGRAWVTKLFFPVHVVERVESYDELSRAKFVSLYKYHDGYYDPEEREFRGFGFTESWDTEAYEAFVATPTAAGFPSNAVDRQLHVAPVYTKTWYHTGAFIESDAISRQYEREYWRGDAQAVPLPANTLGADVMRQDGETIRQAYAALEGQTIRQEVYGLDGSEDAPNPYQVGETSVHVRLVQPRGQNRYAVFYAYTRESLTYHYERNPADPRIGHDITLLVDEYGNVRRSLSLSYPRRATATPPIFPEQTALKAVLAEAECVNHPATEQEPYHLIGVGYESRSYELGGLPAPTNTGRKLEQLERAVAAALKNPVATEQTAPALSDERGLWSRLISWDRAYYWNADQTAALPLGELDGKCLLHHQETAAFTPALIGRAFGKRVTDEMLLSDGGYYPADGYWWNRGLIQYYLTGPGSFSLPVRTENNFSDMPAKSSLHVRTDVTYDQYRLLQKSVAQYLTDSQVNTVTALNDYQALSPRRVTDDNGNVTEVLFDPLGNVVVTTVYGTVGGVAAGDDPLSEYQLRPATFEEVLEHPAAYLQGSTSYFYYDLFAWVERGQPAGVVTLQRERHVRQTKPGTTGETQIGVSYSDGYGRTIESKARTSPGAITMRGAPEAILRDLRGQPLLSTASPRWIVSGRTVYNNKGNPAEQYQPYFSATPDYEDQSAITDQHLVPPPSIIRYDALQRVIRTDSPKGFFSEVKFTPWEVVSYDENDTVLDSFYYKSFMRAYEQFNSTYPATPDRAQVRAKQALDNEYDALSKAAACYNTPAAALLDNAGRTIRSVVNNLGRVSEDAFTGIAEGSSYTSADIWNELVARGYLTADGWVTQAFQPYTVGFNLQLDDGIALGPNKLPAGVWTHVVVVRDWGNKQVTGYVGGEAQDSYPITVDSIEASTYGVTFGMGNFSNYQGQMAEVRLWNIVRSQEEIRADMYRRLTGREPGLAAYWPMNEGGGTTLYDLSPNKNTATLSGNPAWAPVFDGFIRDNEMNGALMHGLFINSALPDGQYLSLASPGRMQVTDGVSTPSNPDGGTLERLQSFIRLTAQLDWSYADLDWALRSLDATVIDDAALSSVALVKQLQSQLRQPVDVLCSFWADMKTVGQGTQAGLPQDLFDRVFNLPDSFYSSAGRRPSPPYHPSYAGNPLYQDQAQSWYVDSTGGDPTYATDTQFRSRLMAALQLNDGDLTALAHYLCDEDLLSAADLNGAAQDAAQHVIGLTVQNLTLFYRYAGLAQLLKLSSGDLLTLLPLVGQPSVASAQDVLKVCGWARWLKQAGLSVPQLNYITTGTPPRPVNQADAEKAAEAMLNALASSARSVMVTPAALLTGGMSQAQAQALFADLAAHRFINLGGVVLHERPLSPQSLAALVPSTADALPQSVSPPQQQGANPARPPSAEDVKENISTHVAAVLRAYMARQNDLVVKTLADGFRASPAELEGATLLTELMQPSSLTFDGADDYSEVTYSSALNTPVFTVSCWVKVQAQTTNWQSVVTSRMGGGTTGGYMIYVEPNNEAPYQGFSFWVGDGTEYKQLPSPTPISNQWTHVAVTYDGTETRLYLDGNLSGGPSPCGYALNTGYPLRIGAGATNTSPEYFFGGEIADLRCWNTALSAAQIQAEMYSQRPQSTDGLAAWWPIKAGGGSTLYDWSLNGHDGPLYEYAGGTRTRLVKPNWHNYHVNQLLDPLEPGATIPPTVGELLSLTAQNLALVKALKLTSYEVAALVTNPAPFGISGLGFSFTPERVRTVWEFKQLCKAFDDTSNQLLAYFAAPSIAALAQITGWDEGQITTLENYLGTSETRPVTDFDSVAGVAALKRCFDVSLTLGVSIDYVLGTLLPLNDLPVLGPGGEDNWALYEATADSVEQVLLKHYQPNVLRAALAAIKGPLQERLRDRLSRLLIWELGETFAGIRTEQDLYEFLLTDVETSSVVQISYLKEGLNALQLYAQRCLTNLENGVVNTIPREWWAWMDSYRVWQANREVYLYPENYIDPTLRKMQSSQFGDFSTQLMQGQLTEKLVSDSYANYMDAAQDLVNLRIVDSYLVEHEEGPKLLHLFGCTRTDPPAFYMRTAPVNETDEGVSVPLWTPWEQVNLNINAEYVTPVYAFDRLFLFWVEQSRHSVALDPPQDSISSATATLAAIKYSFRKMGWGWIQPQTLRDKIVISVDPTTTYQQSYCPAVPFEPDDPSWQKVVALTVPASGGVDDEELLITYGPLMRSYPITPYAPEKFDNLFIDAFDRMIYSALQTGYENPGQYIPVGPTTILTGNLVRRSTQLAVGSDGYTWSGYVYRAQEGASQLQYAKTNLIQNVFAAEEFPPGLINYWPLSDGSGRSYLADLTGSQQIVPFDTLTWETVAGNPFDPQRPFLHFNGTSTVLVAPHPLSSGDGSFPNDYSEITIEAWVNLANVTNNQKVVVITNEYSNAGFSLGVANSNIDFEILGQLSLQQGGLSANQWTHLAFTAKSNGTACAYVNGVKKGSASVTAELPCSGTAYQLIIISIGSAWNEYYVNGFICEVRLWDVQLSDEQVSELYCSTASGLGLVFPRLDAEQGVELLSASLWPVATARPVGNQPGWFIFDNTDEIFLVAPEQAGLPSVTELAEFDTSTVGLVKLSFDDSDAIQTTNLKLSFTRLSTHGFMTLSRLLLTGGVRAMLSLPAQHARELDFGRFNPNTAAVGNTPPAAIDFYGAYGEYYWEIFFYMPLLVGNSFNARQQFTEAKKWYEFIFNPTRTPPDELAHRLASKLAPEPSAEHAPGLVSLWPLNGSPDDVAGDNDMSGTASWAQATLPTGETRQVLNLGGGYLSCANNPTLQITGDQTVEMWLRPTSSTYSVNPWSKSYNAEGDFWLDPGDQLTLYYRYGRHGGLESDGGLTPGTDYWGFVITTDLAVNEWAHVVVVRDVTHNEIRGYVNGRRVFAQGVDFQAQPVAASSSNFLIGGGYNGPFWGQIANVALWQVARTPEEIAASYAGRLGLRRKRFWRFVPFRHLQRQSLYQSLTDPTQILIYEYDPFDPDAIAHQRRGAYEKVVVQRYVNNLINYGDYLFTQDTWETLTEATMYYVLAGDLLGRPPEVVVTDEQNQAATYQDLSDADAGSLPFIVELEPQVDAADIAANAPPQVQELLRNWQTLHDAYFKVPANRVLFSYYKTIADRLYKIRNGLNIEGQPVRPPLFEPPLDPETLVTGGARSWAGDGHASPVTVAAAVPAYRFSYLIQQAKSLASETASLGTALLAALEKQDAEQLALMQATQQNNIFNLTTQIKQSQIDQLQAVNQSLQASLASARLQQSTYQQWLAGGLSGLEIASESLLGAAMPLEFLAMLFEGLASVAFVTLPDNLQWAEKAGSALKATSAVWALLASVSVQTSQLLGMQGEFERRSDDWNLQMQLAANSVTQINAQLQANQYELEASEQDLVVNQTNVEQSQQVVDFLSSKFTNEELYQWMAGQLSTLYYQAYQLACQTALSAQTAYQYELCNGDTFVNTNAWNSQYQGLLAGDSLLSNLEQMEQAYLDNNKRKLEITKTISLMRLAPQALLELKHGGRCKFTLSETLFDLDYPGHYQRAIATVSISIPAVVGPYQNVHATLTQLSNAMVMTPDKEGVKYLLGLTGAADGSVRMNWNPNQEVALSSGIDDSGMFQLNFDDKRYLPFEGTGAVSEWQLSMPKASNPINFESISDVIINLKYSAYDGGRKFAQDVINLSDGQGYYPLKDYRGDKYLSLKQVYGNAWHAFLNGYEGAHTLDFVLASEMFPVNLTGLTLGQGDDEQVFLVPVFAPAITAAVYADMPGVTLNGNSWNTGVVDAAPQPSDAEDAEEAAAFPLHWRIEASLAAGSPLLMSDGRINPALWQDIILIIPYAGTLDWGTSYSAG